MEDRKRLGPVVTAYREHQNMSGKSLQYDPASGHLSKMPFVQTFSNIPISVSVRESKLQLVQIHFDTATFDKIEQDVRVTFTSIIMNVSGTMGGFVGFSILSGVELLFYVLKFFISLGLRVWERLKRRNQQTLFNK